MGRSPFTPAAPFYHVRMGSETFHPSWWLRSGHGQTLWPVFARRVRLTARAQRLDLPDGDCVRLDWVGEGDGPIVIVLPGLQGDLRSPYARGLLRAVAARGWRGVLLNHRGRGEPSRLGRTYHGGMTCDLAHAAQWLRLHEPGVLLAAVGFSIGANMLLKWLGEGGCAGEPSALDAAVAVSPPFQPGQVARHLETGIGRLYQRHLIRSLQGDARRWLTTVGRRLNLTEAELRTLDTLHRFDNRVTAPLHGFADADAYYEQTRTDVLLRHIATPTLIVHARDDPFVPARLIPPSSDVSHAVSLQITASGGHVGFVSGAQPWQPRYWLDQRVPSYLAERFRLADRLRR